MCSYKVCQFLNENDRIDVNITEFQAHILKWLQHVNKQVKFDQTPDWFLDNKETIISGTLEIINKCMTSK